MATTNHPRIYQIFPFCVFFFKFLQNFPVLNNIVQRTASPKAPREENFCDLLKFSCCPTFTWKSFIFWICIFNMIYFIIELAMSSNIKGEFLEPDVKAIMDLGAKYPYNMKRGYIWLFVTPIFLHANFMHILSNTVSILLFGINLESTIGIPRTIAIYFISGICGNMFSALITDSISVGASSCIFGLLGSLLAFLILNWEALRPLGFVRCQLLMMIIFILVLNLMVGVGFKTYIDNYAHLGGLLGGLFLGLFILTPMVVTAYERRMKILGAGLLILFVFIGFLVFYVARNPREVWVY